jgi:hypothetical protein
VRHIPDDELHAYLDQALSRSQCIEIETHLARCARCADLRDDIAALRDRTTALLDSARPRRPLHPAPYEVLLGRAVILRRRSWRRYGLWAASLAGAVAAGWGVRTLLDRPAPPVLAVVSTPVVVSEAAPADDPVALAVLETEVPEALPLPPLAPDPSRFVETEVRLTSGGPNPPAAAPAPVPEAPARLVLDAAWTPTTLPEAEEATGWLVPMLPDLPVTDIRMRRADARGRPLLVVTQRHPTAGAIHTVEGPVEEVAALVAAQFRPGTALQSSDPSRAPPDYVETSGGVRRTHRVVAVLGRLPADSLNVLAQAVVMR